MQKKVAFALTLATLTLIGARSEAMPVAPGAYDSSLIVQIANGCGPGRYRGPGGACHGYGSGPFPGGYYGPYRNAYRWNGCPPGYWRGPWGHCRNTPYHGPLPGGGWR